MNIGGLTTLLLLAAGAASGLAKKSAATAPTASLKGAVEHPNVQLFRRLTEADGEQGWGKTSAHTELMAHAVTTACAAGYTDSYKGDVDAKTGILMISPTEGSCKPCSAGCGACTGATHCTTCNAPLLRSPLLGNHDGGFECVKECDTAHGFTRSGDNCVVSDLKSATTASVEADLASTFKNGHRRLSSNHRRLGGRRLDGVDPKSVPSGTTLPQADGTGSSCLRTGVAKSYKDTCDLFREQVKEQITDRLGDTQQRAAKKTMFDNFLSDGKENGILSNSRAYNVLEVRLSAHIPWRCRSLSLSPFYSVLPHSALFFNSPALSHPAARPRRTENP